MKRFKIVLSFLFILVSLAVLHPSVTAKADPTDDHGVWETLNWTFEGSTGKLTFTNGGTISYTDPWERDWYRNHRADIKTIEFQQEVTLQGTAGDSLFDSLSSLQQVIGLDKLNVSAVTSMNDMFYECDNLKKIDGVENWDVSNVENMTDMFRECGNLVNLEPLRNWKTQKLAEMSGMFWDCTSIENLDALANWDTGKVTSMTNLFQRCRSLNDITGLANWNTGNVTTMAEAFRDCWALTNLDALKNWNTQSIKDMNWMFLGCKSLTNVDGLADWKTENVVDGMQAMFAYCEALVNVDGLANWNTKNVITMARLFDDCSSLTSVNLENWSSQSLGTGGSYYSSEEMFSGCVSLKSIRLGKNFIPKRISELWEIQAPKEIYTGEWIGINTRHIYASSDDFMSQYDGTVPDTYVWRRVTHRISYQFVSGTKDKKLPSVVTETLPASVLSSEVYEESLVSPSLSATEIAADDGVWTFDGWDKKEVTNPEADETVTGTWVYTLKPKMYSVTYHSNYPKVVSTTRQLSDPNEMKLVLHRPALHMHHIVDPNSSELGYKDEGYKFKKWSTTRDGSGKSYVVGDMLEVDGDIDLYAQWEKIKDVPDSSHEDPGNSSGPTDQSTDHPQPPTSTPSSSSKPRFSVSFGNLITAGGAASSKTTKAAKRLPATGDDESSIGWSLCGGLVLFIAPLASLLYKRGHTSRTNTHKK